MDPLGAPASAIAVVELAAKIASLCLKYFSAVKKAKSDIERLLQHINDLKIVLEGARQLLQRPDGIRLEYSQKLRGLLDNTRSRLDAIHKKLEDRLGTWTGRAMRRLGWRALAWPFESKEMEEIIANLQRDQQAVSACLHIDQTYVDNLSYATDKPLTLDIQRRGSRYRPQYRTLKAFGRERRCLRLSSKRTRSQMP